MDEGAQVDWAAAEQEQVLCSDGDAAAVPVTESAAAGHACGGPLEEGMQHRI